MCISHFFQSWKKLFMKSICKYKSEFPHLFQLYLKIQFKFSSSEAISPNHLRNKKASRNDAFFFSFLTILFHYYSSAKTIEFDKVSSTYLYDLLKTILNNDEYDLWMPFCKRMAWLSITLVTSECQITIAYGQLWSICAWWSCSCFDQFQWCSNKKFYKMNLKI